MELQPSDRFKVSIRGRYQSGKRRKHVKGDNWNCRCVNCGLSFVNRMLLRKHYVECKNFEDIQVLADETTCENSISVVIEDAISGTTRPISPEYNTIQQDQEIHPAARTTTNDIKENEVTDNAAYVQPNLSPEVAVVPNDKHESEDMPTVTDEQNHCSLPTQIDSASNKAIVTDIQSQKQPSEGMNEANLRKNNTETNRQVCNSIVTPWTNGIVETHGDKLENTGTLSSTKPVSPEEKWIKFLNSQSNRNMFPKVPHKAFPRPYTSNCNTSFGLPRSYQALWPSQMLHSTINRKQNRTTGSKVYPLELYTEMKHAAPRTLEDNNKLVVDLTDDAVEDRDQESDIIDPQANEVKLDQDKANVNKQSLADAKLKNSEQGKTFDSAKRVLENESNSTDYENHCKRKKPTSPVSSAYVEDMTNVLCDTKTNGSNYIENISDDTTKTAAKQVAAMHSCLHCDLKFRYLSRLKRHEIAAHADREPITTANDSSAISNSNQQDQHDTILKTHDPTCPICGVSFPTKDHLTLHMEVHPTLKPKAKQRSRRNAKSNQISPVAEAFVELNSLCGNKKTEFSKTNDIKSDVTPHKAFGNSMNFKAFDAEDVITHMRNTLLCLQNSPLAQHIVAQRYKDFPTLAISQDSETRARTQTPPLDSSVNLSSASETPAIAPNRKRELSASDRPLDLSVRTSESLSLNNKNQIPRNRTCEVDLVRRYYLGR